MLFKAAVSVFVIVLGLAANTTLKAQEKAPTAFEGLYYPDGDDITWQCNSNSLGEYGGALGVEGNVLYGISWFCDLSHGNKTNLGTEFIAMCEAEGTRYRDLITLRKTHSGLLVQTRDDTSEWLSCPINSSAFKTNWTSGFAMGVSETTATNLKGEQVIFSCGPTTPNPIGISVEEHYQENGIASFIVDDTIHTFNIEDGYIGIDPDCPDCMAKFGRLMKDIFNGQTLTVSVNQTSPIVFNILDAKEAFYGEICLGAGHYVIEDHLECLLVIEGRRIHEGMCSKSEDEFGETVYTVGKDFFVSILFEDEKNTANGYWNETEGANHAHSSLGFLKKEGNCWKNGGASICLAAVN